MKYEVSDETLELIRQFYREHPEFLVNNTLYHETKVECIEKAKKEGMLEYAQTNLIELLKIKFTILPDKIEDRIHSITEIDKFYAYSKQVLTAERLSEFDFYFEKPDYVAVIKNILQEHAQLQPSYSDIESHLVFDDERQRYLLMESGWIDKKYVNDVIIDLGILDGKVCIYYDGTDVVTAEDLLEAGIPEKDIILGFRYSDVMA